jgi:hypothetical protein
LKKLNNFFLKSAKHNLTIFHYPSQLFRHHLSFGFYFKLRKELHKISNAKANTNAVTLLTSPTLQSHKGKKTRRVKQIQKQSRVSSRVFSRKNIL